MSGLKDVLLVGFGAVGAVYSLILKSSGHVRLTVVARSNYGALKEHGAHFESLKYGEIHGWRPDRVFASIAEAADRPYSHVVLTTKAIPEIQTTPELLKPFITSPYVDTHPQPTYVLMQNGLNTEMDLYNALKVVRPTEEPRIINTAVYLGTRLEGKNTVIHNDFDRVSLGIYRSTPNVLANTPSEEATISEFAEMLRLGGTDVTIVPEIQRVKFLKNIWNSVIGPVAVLSRDTPSAIFRPQTSVSQADGTIHWMTDSATPPSGPSQPQPKDVTADMPYSHPAIRENTIPFLRDAFTEVVNLGNTVFPPTPDGPALNPELAFNILKNTSIIFSKPTSTERPSMLVDVELGRPMELEVVVGEVVRLGRKFGVDMPRLETFYALLLVIQRQFLRGKARM
ncbi:hypothetical protein NLI96_g6991 [Meripilus lineatus]|uniref:6-phosphogluconate dehydrogenase C-terminal domain-like protein n=1 Tax=Meripilus lineatus TaxID=2056292 RepID=A0AAD5V295_9APHY|nr:hypothetical protein NLI96_g6991 [Physisporinus lineatus]